ncbi:MAG: hypothetical protein PHW73_05920 [Atribacterota bacterium]|nr:hypothetical protein [Atribacterota bacterium]
MRSLIDKLVEEVAENHAKILDDFVKAYLASRWEDYFSKQKKIDFRRLELVIQHEGIKTIYFCRLKKGKLSEEPSNPLEEKWYRNMDEQIRQRSEK